MIIAIVLTVIDFTVECMKADDGYSVFTFVATGGISPILNQFHYLLELLVNFFA